MFPMLGIVGQAGRCGAASEPRSGGARMVRQAHQPFPRFSACRNRSQGETSPSILEKVPQMRQNSQFSYSDIFHLYICKGEFQCW